MRLVLFITAFFSLASSRAGAVEYLDADNLAEASGMVSLEAGSIEVAREYCAGLLPKHSRIIDYYFYSWELDNQKELDALQIYLHTWDSAKLKASEAPLLTAYLALLKASVAARGAEQICGGMMEQLKSGSRNIAKRTPKASRFLLDYLAEHPMKPLDIDRRNYRTGCLKRSVNDGVGLGDAKPRCTCLADATYAELSQAEIELMKKWVDEGKSLATFEPLLRIQPKVASCILNARQ